MQLSGDSSAHRPACYNFWLVNLNQFSWNFINTNGQSFPFSRQVSSTLRSGIIWIDLSTFIDIDINNVRLILNRSCFRNSFNPINQPHLESVRSSLSLFSNEPLANRKGVIPKCGATPLRCLVTLFLNSVRWDRPNGPFPC